MSITGMAVVHDKSLYNESTSLCAHTLPRLMVEAFHYQSHFNVVWNEVDNEMLLPSTWALLERLNYNSAMGHVSGRVLILCKGDLPCGSVIPSESVVTIPAPSKITNMRAASPRGTSTSSSKVVFHEQSHVLDRRGLGANTSI